MFDNLHGRVFGLICPGGEHRAFRGVEIHAALQHIIRSGLHRAAQLHRLPLICPARHDAGKHQKKKRCRYGEFGGGDTSVMGEESAQAVHGISLDQLHQLRRRNVAYSMSGAILADIGITRPFDGEAYDLGTAIDTGKIAEELYGLTGEIYGPGEK